MKPKYQRHLRFLVEVSQKSETHCLSIFQQNMLDIRHSLLMLLADPDQDTKTLLKAYETTENETALVTILQQLFTQYAPNPKLDEVLEKLRLRQYENTIDTESQNWLKRFKKSPKTTAIEQLFAKLPTLPPKAIVSLFSGLVPFGKKVAPYIFQVQNHVYHADQAVQYAALDLLPHIPDGVLKSWSILSALVQQKAWRLKALTTIQKAPVVPLGRFLSLARPTLDEYERLSRHDGKINDLWKEYNIILDIFRRNGGQGMILNMITSVKK